MPPSASHHRHQPLRLSRGVTLRNRIVVPAMASETADSQGFVTDETRAHYRRLAESGAGLIIVEYTYVSPSGRSEPRQLGAWSDAHVAGLTEIAAIIKASGAVAGLQLVHGGAKTSRDLTGGVLLGPSAIRVPVKDRDLEVPTAMSPGDVAHLKDSFARAADRAVQAGFALVEIHAAHGYGLNQWLSPLTNQRTDEYGGDLWRRSRLLREIIVRLREERPALVLSARIPGQDFLAGGLTVDDMIVVTKSLLEAGLDVVSVSSGLGGWRRPKERRDQGYLVEEAARIQASVAAPVIGVGGIETGSYIDQAIGEGRIALAAVGRAILKDPAAWRDAHVYQGDSMEFQASPAEDAALRATVQNYIDGFLSYDTALLRQTFDGEAKLIAASDGKVQGTATASWFDRIDERRQGGAVQPPATSHIAGIDQHGDAAVARVELDFATYRFTDYLSLLKTEAGWKVVSKVYTMA